MAKRGEALAYAAAGILVFPCHSAGPARKCPIAKLVPRGCLDASRDESLINDWWHRRPDALIGGRTGLVSGFVVLDVDIKDPAKYGFDTLAELGFAVLPDTVMVHTASGGLHIWFDPQGCEIRNTEGTRGRGIGPGLDWRGDGGYVILPSPGSGYWFDPCHPLGSALAPVPVELLPREPEALKAAASKPVYPTSGLSPYAHAALKRACLAIQDAPNGEQESTLNSECYSIGRLAGAGAIPDRFAREALLWSAQKIPSYDSKRPWRATDIQRKVCAAFDAGKRHPRQARCG